MRSLFALLFACLCLATGRTYGNAAQPGIFEAGGAGNFTLLYFADSASFRKIQMVNEHIAIQLYRGFAVVRGEYKMYNTVDSALTIRVGYPVNSAMKGSEHGGNASQIYFDQLYALKSYTNGKENQLIVQPAQQRMSLEENNWYVWSNTFKPKDTTTITVYFIVNTNNTIVRQGYTTDRNNGFIYLLESGASWKQPIVKGEIKIALMDELKPKDIRGLTPVSAFKINADNNVLFYSFSNLSPTVNDNVVLVYTPAIEQFDFSYISQKRQLLFGSIDTFASQSINEAALASQVFDDPYTVRSVSYSSLLKFAFLFAGAIFAAIFIVWGLRALMRYIRSQRTQRGT